MTTRRELLKDGIGIGAILASHRAPAIVKSLIGCSQTQLDTNAPTYSAASYVQDGLIAMWDGIENVGYGIHDSNATIWKDLVGSLNLTLAGGGSFGDTYLQCNGTTVAAYTTANSGAIQQMTAQYLISDVVPANTTRNLVCLPGSSGLNTPVAALQIIEAGEMAITHDLRFSAPAYDSLILATVEGDNSKVSYYGSPPSLYLNKGIRVAKSTSISINNSGVSICVGSRRNSNGSFSYPAQGKVHRISIYSKYLSPEEIAKNYEVDKERFGI